ncbi:hypothetical protein [Roseomonas xinghualingensis]|uniref:hypothetical protein n=1 Tax=Roseomonas xinghualingensis TaxID=2986475 RepID=UPI0021F23EE4|nr:hypothetical protein [Roseomonas sp. SXEYE001]MCV4209367.1 hypothetical protein [Roseomonas sp. SXEYE001]
MIRISVRHDFDKLSRTLDAFSRKQMPFATARALTATAREAGSEFTRSMPETLDRPTPFTMRAVGITAARKNSLRSVVFIKDRQAEYLGYQEKGGHRGPKRRALVMPAGMRLNRYGNMPNRAVAKAIGRPDVFVGEVNGIGGIWQRPKAGGRQGAKKGPKLLATFRPGATYKPRLGFEDRVMASVRQQFPRHMQAALHEALKTARR